MGLPNGYLGRVMFVFTVVLAARGTPLGAAVDAPVLIEGFERLAAGDADEKVKPVTSGPGLTQGSAAAKLEPEGAISVKVRGLDIAGRPWFRIDTHHTADSPHGLDIRIATGKFRSTLRGCVRKGKDTLAFPLTMAVPSTKAKPDQRILAIRITNPQDTPIVIDNIRLEPPVRTPPGAVLYDFGGTRNPVWPGFTRQGVKTNLIKWTGKNSYRGGYNVRYPDPLTQDFIGPYWSRFGNNMKVTGVISAGNPDSTAAWLWLTHYGARYTQPQEYICRASTARPVGKKLTATQLIGPDGLLEGAGEPWTPEWYAKDYADHFVTLMPFTMTKGKAMVELGNCQIAALAMAPIAGRSAMTACIKKIQNELAQFRRQFVMRKLVRNPCRLEPTEAETKLGLMLFHPPPDEAFTGLWKPAADQRAWAIHAIARPGAAVRIPLAFTPLQKRSAVFSITPGSLRSDFKSTLPLNRSNIQIDYVKLVPDVRAGAAIQRPWLMAAKSPIVDVGEIGYVWVTLNIPPKARGGLYRGVWKLRSGSARTSIPVEIEVVDCGQSAPRKFTVASSQLPAASTVYAAALSALPASRQKKLKSDVFKQVHAAGVNAYVFTGVRASRSRGGSVSLYPSNMNDILSEFPLKKLDGVMFIDISQAMGTLSWGRSGSGRKLLGKVIAQTNQRAAKHSIDRRYFYLGYAKTIAGGKWSTGLATRLAGARRCASGECRVALGAPSSIIAEIDADSFAKELKSVSALLLRPDSSSVASQVAAFRKLGGKREVHLLLSHPDRLAMGFYAAAVQADGCVVPGVFMSGGPYNGYYIDGGGVVAPQSGGRLTQTVSAFRMAQARDDRNLVYQARSLVAEAKAAKAPAGEISDILSEIKSRLTSLETLKYDETRFATTEVSQAEMDSWRGSLLNAMGVVQSRLAGAKRK